MLVKVKEGWLEGEVMCNLLGGQYYSFKGIPYAAPPVGKLRFQPPQTPSKWSGTRSAKQFGPICHQYNLNLAKQSEDCLYLNVFTKQVEVTTLMPVMVYIHGGGFASGSGDDFEPDFLINKDVVYVSFNYRLGVLGFLSLGSREILGNAGMKDQVAALRWVKENISNFGGDPNIVTVFGESAGAASITYHLVSPMSKGLFRRAIVQSGAATGHWAHTNDPRERAKALARKLGKDTDDDKELYDFFMSVNPESLHGIKMPITEQEEARLTLEINFSVVSENVFDGTEAFFTGDAYEAFSNNEYHEDVEVMAGYCLDEGFLAFNENPVENIVSQYEIQHEYFAPRKIAEKATLSKQKKVGKMMKEFYYGNQSIKYLEPLLRFFSMEYIDFEMYRFAQGFAKTNNVYFYKFAYISDRNHMGKFFRGDRIIGSRPTVCHGDDLPYLFPLKSFNIPFDPQAKSLNVIERVTTLWTNFAKFGDPDPDLELDVKWRPYSQESQEYLMLDYKPQVRTFFDDKEMQYWNTLLQKYQHNDRYII